MEISKMLFGAVNFIFKLQLKYLLSLKTFITITYSL